MQNTTIIINTLLIQIFEVISAELKKTMDNIANYKNKKDLAENIKKFNALIERQKKITKILVD